MIDFMLGLTELHPVYIFVEGAIFFLGWKVSEVVVGVACDLLAAVFGDKPLKVGFKKDE